MPSLLNRYNLLKIVNPVLNLWFSLVSPTSIIKARLTKSGIKHLNLGGYRPTAGYLNIQLSPVELYGIPTLQRKTTILVYDKESGEITQKTSDLSSPGISLHFDITKGLPLASNSMAGINMSHILEHFTRAAGKKVLQECWRVLEPGGILRISCPDLKMYLKAYVEQDSSFYYSIAIQKACCYDGLTTYGDLFISKAYDNHNGHKWFYDAESTIQLLSEAGFQQAEEKHLHESYLPEIDSVEPSFRAVESFYVEAKK